MARKTFIILLLLILLPGLLWAGRQKGRKRGKTGTMSVQVREVIVKSSPSYLSSSAGKLTYGTEVNVTSISGSWCQISSPPGWLPKSALTKRKIKINPDQKYAGGSKTRHDEVALAGKGFNPEVEAKYKRGNPALAAAYGQVDRVETFGATEGQLKAFCKAGKLR